MKKYSGNKILPDLQTPKKKPKILHLTLFPSVPTTPIQIELFSCPLCDSNELFQTRESYKNHINDCRELLYPVKPTVHPPKQTNPPDTQLSTNNVDCKALVCEDSSQKSSQDPKNSSNSNFKPTKIIEIGVVDNFYTKSSKNSSSREKKKI